jgi:adenylate cyclase
MGHNQLFQVLDQTDDQTIWKQLGKTWAILCLDPTGFTRTVSKYGILHYLRLIKQMRDLAPPIMQTYGALKWKAKADNLYACFAHPNQALSAAIALKTAVADAKIMLDETEPFGVCIGIGYGKMLDAGDDGVYGDEVNLAYKLGEDVAESGEILLTQKSYEQVHLSAQRFESCTVKVSGNSIPYYKLIDE